MLDAYSATVMNLDKKIPGDSAITDPPFLLFRWRSSRVSQESWKTIEPTQDSSW